MTSRHDSAAGERYGPFAPTGAVEDRCGGEEVDVMTQDRAKGKFNQGKGKVKEQLGKVLGDRSTEWSGRLDQVKGKVQEKVGEAEDTGPFDDGRTR